MPKPLKHVFVCAQSRPPGHPRGSCAQLGCATVLQTFSQQFEANQLHGQFSLTSTGCLGACDIGPTVIVYPDAVMYSKVQPGDVAEIIESHLKGGTPVERLKAPEAVWS